MVKIFKDGKKMTVIFENTNDKTMELIENIIKEANEEKTSIVDVEGLTPSTKNVIDSGEVDVIDLTRKTNIPDDRVRIPKGLPYGGTIVKQFIKNQGMTAVITLLDNLKHVEDEHTRLVMKHMIGDYIQREFKDVKIEEKTIEDMKQLLMFSFILTPELEKEILEKTTYPTMLDLLTNASKEIITQAYASTVKKLLQTYK